MIAMTVIVRVRPEKREELLQAIRSLNNGREKQEGLRKSTSTSCQEIGDHTGFSVIYEWETQEDCTRYLGSEKFRALLADPELLCEKLEIQMQPHF